MTFLLRLYDRLLDALGMLAALLLAGAALLIAVEILLRGFSLGSLPWVIEAVEYTLLAVTFLAAPWVLRAGAHVRVDIVVENLRPRFRRIADAMANVIGLVVCAIIFYYGLKSAIGLYDSGTRIFKILVVKEWWLFALVPFSCSLMFIEFARRLIQGRSPPAETKIPTGEAGL